MNPWIQATGWTLIHFLWQGVVLAAITALGLRLSRRASPNVRYAVAGLGLTAMLVAPAATLIGLRSGEVARPSAVDLHTATAASGSPTVDRLAGANPSSPTRAAQISVGIERALPVLVWLWLTGVGLLVARFAGGCWRVHRWRTASLAGPVSAWQAVAERIAARLDLAIPFRVVESPLVDAPSVIGAVRPIVLLPIAALANLSVLQIEALLAHELAHIRRRDYAVNLLQTVAEALLFFHPAVWWVSARIRQEREHCCDDIAVALCGEPTAYAEALTELAAWRVNGPALAMGAADGSLLARVRRLLRVPDEEAPRSVGGLATLAAALLLIVAVAVPSASRARAQAPTAAAVLQSAGADQRLRTDHFEIHYPADLDLQAARVAVEAERAYVQASAELRHSLAFPVPVILFRTVAEMDSASGRSVGEASRDRILLAVDDPADRWAGRFTHEVTHVFGFDILPGTGTPTWITEGLAEYVRGSWDPADLVVLRDAVRANAVPKLTTLGVSAAGTDARAAQRFGHAAFDFIESRWGKAGVRQWLFALRQTARTGADPYQAALQIDRRDFDAAFERYLRQRLTSAPSPAGRFDAAVSRQLDGEVIGISSPVAEGLACVELWVGGEGVPQERWAIECGDDAQRGLVPALKPGDRVVVTGAPARAVDARRLRLRTLARPSDGLTLARAIAAIS